MKNTINVKAHTDELENVIAFVQTALDNMQCPQKTSMQIIIAVEEIFVNTALYGYEQTPGNVRIDINFDSQKNRITITFVDSGTKFNPLIHEAPDTTLSAEQRNVGGLGIHIVKNMMWSVNYEYFIQKNKLTLTKNL